VITADWLPLIGSLLTAANIGALSVVPPMVLSEKLSKIDPRLLWYTIRKLALLILLPHSDPPELLPWRDIWVSNSKYVQMLIQPPVGLGIRPQLMKLSTTVVSLHALLFTNVK